MRIARATGQLSLLDTPPRFRLGSNALARNAYGAAAQEIVCSALKLEGIPINGNCEFCADAERRETGDFFEIKSVHRSSKVVVYDWRMEKEASVSVPLTYAILAHNCRKVRDGAALLSAFAAGGLEILELPAREVHRVAFAEPLQTMKKSAATGNPRNGYSRKGYANGYRNCPVARLRALCREVGMLSFELHGLPFAVHHYAAL